jgi:Spy/CpxP family protein refolding chaperone
MKRIALFAVAAAGSAALVLTQLRAEETTPPSPAPTADAPAKKEGWKKMNRGQDCGPGKFGHRRGFEGFRHRGPAEGMALGHMLNLTDDQKAKVKEIMDANRPKIEAIRKEEMARIKAVMEESMKQIEPLLTPDQKQVLTDMEKLRASREKLRQDKTKPTE